MQKVVKGCLVGLLVLLLGVGIVLLITSLTTPNNSEEQSGISGNANVNADGVVVTSVVGVKFKIPNSWVLSETEYSQCTIYPNISNYHKEGANAISITSSWVDSGFVLKGYADTFYDALAQSETVASVERNSYKLNDYDIEEITFVNNGVFGGYCYFMKGNVIVEILYGSNDPDKLDFYRDTVNDILVSFEFIDGVKKDDFPVVEESSEISDESSVEESSKSVVGVSEVVDSDDTNSDSDDSTVDSDDSTANTANNDSETASTEDNENSENITE